MNNLLIKNFKQPLNFHRGTPFWCWNEKLAPSELRRQIRIMKQMGFGGFFIHSRAGLKTHYLSNEWFECVNTSIEEAEKVGLNVWLYDEDRWPSGSAGGLVTQKTEYQRKYLLCKEFSDIDKFAWNENIIAAFIVKHQGEKLIIVEKLNESCQINNLENGNIIISFEIKSEKKSEWFNGQTDIDTLNPAAVKEFIRVTHEKYKKFCGQKFGRMIKGFFTDEPAYGSVMEENKEDEYCIPWTPGLPIFFKNKYGYDLLPRLPEIIFNLDVVDNLKTRYDYFDCITSLFVDSFSRQIGKWCEKNDLLFTGHIAWEDTLSTQTVQTGSCMRFYEHMHIPGMDLLTEQCRLYDVAKQVSSVARQFGRKWRLTETYGCTGWDFPFYGHKALGDWQLALGINFRSHHLYWYSMKGQRKRDYPASIGHQSPWWQIYSVVEDYFARLNVVLSHGSEVRDILVIHPVESMWLQAKKGWWGRREKNAYDNKLTELSDWLLANHLDFDYGEEDIIARHASVCIKKGVAVFAVGQAEYTTIIIPSMITIRKTTLELLGKFNQAGGKIIFWDSPPKYVDALISQEAEILAGKCLNKFETHKVGEEYPRRVSITDENGKEIPCVLYQLREDKQAFYLFICNTGHSQQQLKRGKNDDVYQISLDVKVSERKEKFPKVCVTGFDKCDGWPQEWLPQTGERFSAQARRLNDKKWEISTNLKELGTRVFVIPKKQTGKLSQRYLVEKVEIVSLETHAWDFSLSEPNVFVLDCAKWRIDNGMWSKKTEILKIDEQIRHHMGLNSRGGSSIQPWATDKHAPVKKKSIELEYTFDIEQKVESNLSLALEDPKRFIIELNGHTIPNQLVSGWWVDPSLKCVEINSKLLRVGKNILLLKSDYRSNDDGLEAIFILGNFGVYFKNKDPYFSLMPNKLHLGSWLPQGLPFFSGSVTYNREINLRSLKANEKLFVCVPQYRGCAVKISINNVKAGVIAWAPNEVDITRFVKSNNFELNIEVIAHRRNSHGPLHYYPPQTIWTGPEEFSSIGANWKDEYQLVSCGLLESPFLEIRK